MAHLHSSDNCTCGQPTSTFGPNKACDVCSYPASYDVHSGNESEWDDAPGMGDTSVSSPGSYWWPTHLVNFMEDYEEPEGPLPLSSLWACTNGASIISSPPARVRGSTSCGSFSSISSIASIRRGLRAVRARAFESRAASPGPSGAVEDVPLSRSTPPTSARMSPLSSFGLSRAIKKSASFAALHGPRTNLLPKRRAVTTATAVPDDGAPFTHSPLGYSDSASLTFIYPSEKVDHNNGYSPI